MGVLHLARFGGHSRLLCLRHGRSLCKVSYREDGKGCASSARSASSARTSDSGRVSKTERLWKDFVLDPSQWWDNRLAKRSPQYPDFKHRRTREALWMDSSSNPPWVNPELIAATVGEPQSHNGSNFQVHNGAPGKDCWYCFVDDDS